DSTGSGRAGEQGKGLQPLPWILRAHAEENWRTVRANLESSIAQLGELTGQPAPEDVVWRLRTMHLNTQVFFRIFANMHNHMRALQAMERLSHLPHESPRLKAELAPIIRDDIANTEALVELLGQFPSNFFLSGKHERDNKLTRDAE